MQQKLIFTGDPASELAAAIDACGAKQIYLLADSNTAVAAARPLKEKCDRLADVPLIIVKAGDMNKNVDSLCHVWEELGKLGATRKSLLINVGGGMVTDLGGFAGATFKRGIRFINIPTTLLAAVDAAVGGKTGINFGGLKNEVGAFCEADAVIISTCWLSTLSPEEICSGYAEMIKHGLISGIDSTLRLLDYDISSADTQKLLPLVEESVMVKKRVVEEDPHEHGIRRALNLGHTAGHAFESWSMKRGCPVAHGYAVAWGLVVDLILSHMRLGFDAALLRRVAGYVREHYGVIQIGCDDYPSLISLMRHDKKNASADSINFTLLDAPGKVRIDCIVDEKDICVALDIFRDLMGI